MKKIGKYLSITLPFLAANAIMIIVSINAMIAFYFSLVRSLYSARSKVGGENLNISDILMQLTETPQIFMDFLMVLIPVIWAVTFFFWYRVYLKREAGNNKITFNATNMRKLFSFKSIGTIAILGIGLQLFLAGALSLILPYFDELSRQYQELMEQAFGGNPIVAFICVAILAPISEELICRGVTLKKACGIVSFPIANVIQAFLFGVLHMNLVQGCYAFIGGLVLGYVAHKYQSVLASMLLHMFMNVSSYFILEFENSIMYLLYVGIGAVIMAFSLYQVKKLSTKSQIVVPLETIAD